MKQVTHPSPEPSTAAKKITVPAEPTKEGYVFSGWYTDADCTEKFDFNDNDGTVEQDTTLYAKWIPEDKAVTITDFNITNVEHNDADKELNQKINVTLDFKVSTGDVNHVYPYLMLVLVSCMAIVVMLRKKKSYK